LETSVLLATIICTSWEPVGILILCIEWCFYIVPRYWDLYDELKEKLGKSLVDCFNVTSEHSHKRKISEKALLN
jgi:hypothetical protein